MSNSGNGATIVLVPDAPISLIRNAQATSQTVIAFSWTQPSFNGGSSVIDYLIRYDQANGTYVTLATTTVLSY